MLAMNVYEEEGEHLFAKLSAVVPYRYAPAPELLAKDQSKAFSGVL